MTRVFYDLEFLEDGKSITLISIGLVTDDGREYYAVNGDLYGNSSAWVRIKAHDWLVRNVLPSLPLTNRKALEKYLAGATMFSPIPSIDSVKIDTTDTTVKPRYVIANEVRDFIRAAGPDVELWAWYGAYDHVALCWLWGRMIDLPEGIPMWTNDLRQERLRLGEPEMPRQADGEHNALEDARHNRDMARFLDEYAETNDKGPMRWSHAGWDVTLDTNVGKPPHVTFKRHGETVINGYVHPDATLASVSNFNQTPDMVIVEQWADDDSR